ncbi:tripartite tricarboxylate transporter TctB family protein [Aestuariicoccus sp. MJ-SS9]|uniref:tripartite tricarboxylate transporter TctB family protein n=1 Tax=Aestuariicoccus sp. MJ-SS9 TaxID=3079855 RepID=UPI0029068556|nr:tripartite tricarboxylate transporter TctB family protein [Aestuariicoccus sp. MJ-SS9]MDU8912376.1 tripartite tricarboxylate transporter TctB family protein [Aestuariicoccus sp. MJ-SS9]
MLLADRVIAAALMALSVYFMVHATALPIGWNGATGGPGGGAFPFWLSLIMLLAAGGILIRSFVSPGRSPDSFFDMSMLRSVLAVVVALVATIALIPVVGAYIAIPLFLFWYLRLYGGHGWVLTLSITLATPVFLFFFFEVTLRILLPKGITEPLFFPLYAMLF